MQYKIELRYSYGWDDADWTEDTDEESKSSRFKTLAQAHTALNEFFANVKAAVVVGDMDTEEDPNDYRIVAVNNRG